MVQLKVDFLPPSVELNQNLQLTRPAKSGKIALIDNKKQTLKSSEPSTKPQHPKIYYTVVHQTAGRMRLRIPYLHQSDYAQRLQMLLETDKFFTSIRIKPAAASLTVTYEPNIKTTANIQRHISHILQAANQVVVLKSNSQPQAETEEKPYPSWKFSAAATTLAIMGGPLGLSVPPMLIATTIALATFPVAQRALGAIRDERKLNIDFLDLMAIVITTVQGQFFTPALMLGLIEIGENIRDRTARPRPT
jgi:P-type Cu2+ transporter